MVCTSLLQQLLPFTVLKPISHRASDYRNFHVATALTVYGIETLSLKKWLQLVAVVATALTVYGIETCMDCR